MAANFGRSATFVIAMGMDTRSWSGSQVTGQWQPILNRITTAEAFRGAKLFFRYESKIDRALQRRLWIVDTVMDYDFQRGIYVRKLSNHTRIAINNVTFTIVVDM